MNSSYIIGETRSLCPICLKQIPAKKIQRDDEVILKKLARSMALSNR